jgi:GT2 family glycosyltransferase
MDWDNVESIHIGVNEVDMGQYDNPGPTEFVTGASMLLNAQMLREVGVFDERFFLYYEENDLCRRALKSGWKLFYQPKSVVWHANAQAAGIGSPLQDYFITRNKLLFASIWASWRTKFALFRQAVRLLITGRKWQKLGVKDFFLARFGPGTYPISS